MTSDSPPKKPAAAKSQPPVLNWKELARLTESYRPEVEGLFVDRVVIPERSRFPAGYLKGEWIIRLSGRKKECCLLFSIRPRKPYLALISEKGPKASSTATHSAFDLSLSKHLKGAKLLELKALPRERTVVLWFSQATAPGNGGEKLGLVLTLIPAAPEALLVSVTPGDPLPGWQILARSRVHGELNRFIPPDGAKAPEDLPVREVLVRSPETFLRAIDEAQKQEAFELRAKAVEKRFKELLKLSSDRARQSESAIRDAEEDQDWQYFADALKNSLGNLPPCEKLGDAWFRIVPDYLREEVAPGEPSTIHVPCDPNLSPKEQLEKLYQLARRRTRRIEEASSRLRTFSESRDRFEKLLGELAQIAPAQGESELPESRRWATLAQLESAAQITPQATAAAPGKGGKAGEAWLGKSFLSKDGAVIYVGRNKTENLELTFKRARGNDLWMHLRGRPGSHVLIPIQPGKSVSLETLLDAANLCIFYSGGEKWGKTEVDYTFKKHVKRIKDSTEASYTHNKTLLVEPDSARLKRLLSADDATQAPQQNHGKKT